MTTSKDVLLTALAPAIWGSTYIVTTEFLPSGYPLTMSMLRALPAGLLLLVFIRKLPDARWLPKVLVLGALNFTIFWSCLFLAAYRLPGGIAATVGALQPLFVIFMAHALLATAIRATAVLAAAAGVGGVSLLVLTPTAALDPIGVIAGLTGAASMAAGTVLSRKWQSTVPLLTFTAWQLTAGGVLLVPLALVLEPPLPLLEVEGVIGLSYLGLIGAALTYYLWFRGIGRIEPSAVSTLGFLSPVTAFILGWVILGQHLNHLQMLGVGIVLVSIWIAQGTAVPPKPARTPLKTVKATNGA